MAGKQVATEDIQDITTEQLVKTFEVNVFSLFWIAKAVLPHLPDKDLGKSLETVMSDFAIVSREPIIREYDHEVQGNTILKPLAGATADAPQDGSVVDIDGSDKCMAMACAILPEWGKTDPYAMGTGTVDECVRQRILVGSTQD